MKRNSTHTLKVTSIFENIEASILEYFYAAESNVSIAVAWFTNKKIFKAVLDCISRGVNVSLITLYDQINLNGGLRFQKLIDLGGKLYLSTNANSIMHNKYCIIDNKYVISGSYNFTYYAEQVNLENILVIENNKIAEAYQKNFDKILKYVFEVVDYKDFKKKNSIIRDTFSATRFNTIDSYLEQCMAEYTSVDSELSEITPIESSSLMASDNFWINDVCYKMWQQDYIIDKISYYSGELIISFRTITDTGCFICSQGTRFCWKLEAKNSHKIYESFKVSNIKVNDTITIRRTALRTYYHFSNVNKIDAPVNHPTDSEGCPIDIKGKRYKQVWVETPDKSFTLSCDIHFKIDGIEETIFHLLEGDESCINSENFWHAKHINLSLNRIRLGI